MKQSERSTDIREIKKTPIWGSQETGPISFINGKVGRQERQNLVTRASDFGLKSCLKEGKRSEKEMNK